MVQLILENQIRPEPLHRPKQHPGTILEHPPKVGTPALREELNLVTAIPEIGDKTGVVPVPPGLLLQGAVNHQKNSHRRSAQRRLISGPGDLVLPDSNFHPRQSIQRQLLPEPLPDDPAEVLDARIEAVELRQIV